MAEPEEGVELLAALLALDRATPVAIIDPSTHVGRALAAWGSYASDPTAATRGCDHDDWRLAGLLARPGIVWCAECGTREVRAYDEANPQRCDGCGGKDEGSHWMHSISIIHDDAKTETLVIGSLCLWCQRVLDSRTDRP